MKPLVISALLLCITMAAQAQNNSGVARDSISVIATPNLLNNQPFYILNDQEISYDQMVKINPETIDSIRVLKSLKETSPYGEKAKNGVVLIFSKNTEKKKMPRKQ